LMSTEPTSPATTEGDEPEEPQDIEVTCSPCEPLDQGQSTFAISIRVPDATQVVPVEICCVLDISGSMAEPAKYEDEKGQIHTVWLTVKQKNCDDTKRIEATLLDVALHAIRLTIN